MKIIKTLTAGILLYLPGGYVMAQASISGNIATTYQYLNSDSKINAVQPDEKSLLNAYANANFRLKGFKAGMRIESYLPRILGYPDRFDGVGSRLSLCWL